MKPIISFFLIAMGFFSTITMASTSSENIILTIIQEDPITDDVPDKGFRSAHAPVICMVNFTNSTIEISVPEEIALYEICEEDGESVIAYYNDENDMVEHLSHLSGIYQIRFVTNTYSYFGYINL